MMKTTTTMKKNDMDEGLMILYQADYLIESMIPDGETCVLYQVDCMIPGVYMIPDGKTCDCVSDFFDPIIPASYHISLIRDLMLSGF